MAQRVPLGLEEVAIAVWECPGDGPEQDKAAWDAGLMSLTLHAAFLLGDRFWFPHLALALVPPPPLMGPFYFKEKLGVLRGTGG